MPDVVVPFLFDRRDVRGLYVEIESGVAEMLGHRTYPPDVRRLVGEACAAAPLLAATIHFDGRLNLQFQGRGPLKLLVAQADSDLNVRGMAKSEADAAGNLQELMGGGVLALMLEPARASQQAYQAVVSASGETLAHALEGYFERSEQLGTRVRLAATERRLSGVLIQRLPGGETEAGNAHWEHLSALFGTLSAAELAEEQVERLLLRAFPDEDIRVFDPRPVHLACRCSHASISGMLVSLGREELEQMRAAGETIEVTCEFCGRRYDYTTAEIQELLAAVDAGAQATTRH